MEEKLTSIRANLSNLNALQRQLLKDHLRHRLDPTDQEAEQFGKNRQACEAIAKEFSRFARCSQEYLSRCFKELRRKQLKIGITRENDLPAIADFFSSAVVNECISSIVESQNCVS